MEARFERIIHQVNKDLLPYQQITRLKVLDEPMEVGGTLKIRRHTVG